MDFENYTVAELEEKTRRLRMSTYCDLFGCTGTVSVTVLSHMYGPPWLTLILATACLCIAFKLRMALAFAERGAA